MLSPSSHSLEPTEEASPRVLAILAKVIEKLVARNERIVGGMKPGLAWLGKNLNSFDGARAPNISIQKYLERLYKYTNCSPSCLVVGYVYIDRLVHKHPHSLVLPLNVHRLLVTCVMVASKMLDDEHYNNALYAKVGGVSNAELNKMEIELLFLLDFGVTVNIGIFESYCLHLEREMAFLQVHRPISPATSLDIVSVEDTHHSSPPPSLD